VKDWRLLLKKDPLPWLIKFDEPSLKYLLLTEVLDKPPDDPDVIAAEQQILRKGFAASIIATQQPKGHWGQAEDFYIRSKYKGTVWNTILLAELGARNTDPRIVKLIDFLMGWSKRDDGGYSDGKNKAGMMKNSMPCLTANMVWSFCRFGSGSDHRLNESVDLLATPLQEWQNSRLGARCVNCRTGWVKVLKALNALPSNRRTAMVEERRDEIAEAIKEHVLPKSLNAAMPYRPEWSELSFPLMWNTDLVEMLDVLSYNSRWDERMRPALEIILNKQDNEGRWPLERSWNGRMAVRIDRLHQPSPWVTLKAITMLKRLPD
jgi:hypothetical protein